MFRFLSSLWKRGKAEEAVPVPVVSEDGIDGEQPGEDDPHKPLPGDSDLSYLWDNMFLY